jgi:putative ABC transport system permease protein
MLKNHFIVAWRNLLRNKVFSLINIIGLSIGITVCFLIVLYVHFELSYDRFHQNSQRLYRVAQERIQGTTQTLIAANHPGIAPALKHELPEIAEVARMLHQSIFTEAPTTTWSHTDKSGNVKVFNEERVYDVDPSFLTMFSFPFLYGDPRNCLDDKNSIVISETIAKKFFDNENPLGKVLELDGRRSFTITGVFKDVPQNSHIQFDILLATFLRDRFSADLDDPALWKWPEFYTYVLLDEKADPAAFEAKLPAFTNKYLGPRMAEMQYEERMVLQPITDIHLKSPVMTKEREVHGSAQTVYFLLVVALLILVIAWVNYINLSTSKSIERSREIGIRKVTGATKGQLIRQFLVESAMVNIISILVSFVLIGVTWPYFKALTGKNISNLFIDSELLAEPWFWGIAGIIFLCGSFLAGLYPAFILSSFKVANILKGKFFGSKSGIATRKTLVTIQFMISVALIAGTIIVFMQVSFMRTQDLGYEKDQLLIVKTPRVSNRDAPIRMINLKTVLKENPHINSISASTEIPGKLTTSSHWIRNMNDGIEGNVLAQHYFVDHEFLATYKIKLLAGRPFREGDLLAHPDERKDTTTPIILNQKGIESIGFKNPEDAVDQLFYFGLGAKDDWIGKIIGVVGNHHQRSLREDFEPMIFFPRPDFMGEYLTINISTDNAPQTVSFIGYQYVQLFPGNSFEYFFLDEYFNRQYATDQQFGKIFGLFSGVALLVATLGLFGLVTFMISQRTKEIAIRKVLGATISGMVYLFSRDFLMLIALANVISLPLVYLGAQRWLNNFAFHAGISWVALVIPAIILLIISLATISLQTIRTGSANLSRVMRSEA